MVVLRSLHAEVSSAFMSSPSLWINVPCHRVHVCLACFETDKGQSIERYIYYCLCNYYSTMRGSAFTRQVGDLALVTRRFSGCSCRWATYWWINWAIRLIPVSTIPVNVNGLPASMVLLCSLHAEASSAFMLSPSIQIDVLCHRVHVCLACSETDKGQSIERYTYIIMQLLPVATAV